MRGDTPSRLAAFWSVSPVASRLSSACSLVVRLAVSSGVMRVASGIAVSQPLSKTAHRTVTIEGSRTHSAVSGRSAAAGIKATWRSQMVSGGGRIGAKRTSAPDRSARRAWASAAGLLRVLSW